MEATPQKHTQPRWPSAAGTCLHQVRWHFITWHHGADQPAPLGVMPKGGRDWNMGEAVNKKPESACIFLGTHQGTPASFQGSTRSLCGRRTDASSWILLFRSSWPWLLALAGRNSCLPVPSPITACWKWQRRYKDRSPEMWNCVSCSLP